MSYGLSIDVGTSFTAAAVCRTDGPGQETPQILPLGSRATSIPTVVFIGEDGTRLVGETAVRRGLAQPECVTREFKRRMGDEVPLIVGGAEVSAQDLLAAVVSWVVGVASEREGEAPDTVTLTHPVGWEDHRRSLLRQASSDAGIGNVVLMTEPEAAALSYAAREGVACGSTLAVYDLGGGTFDATVVQKTDENSFAVLGTPQGLERLGGADFDQEIFDSVLVSAGITPDELDPTPEVVAALNGLRRECAEAKEALSTDSEASVAVMIPGAHTRVRLVRSEFEAMIEPALAETVETMRSALESARVRAEDLTAILLIGGSSRIPLVAQVLSDEFDRPLAIDLDPKASVALGAALATAVLEEDPDGTDGRLVPGTPAAPADPVGTGGGGGLPGRTTAGPSPLPRRSPPVPRHGPASMAPNRRLGVRVAAITAAVALLGVATASATDAPHPPAASSAAAGDQRAEPVGEASTGSGAASTGSGEPEDLDPAAPLADAGDAPTFLGRALGAGADPVATDVAERAQGIPARQDRESGTGGVSDVPEGTTAPPEESTDGTAPAENGRPSPSPSAAPSASDTGPEASRVVPAPPLPLPPTPVAPDPSAPVPGTSPAAPAPAPPPVVPPPVAPPTVAPPTDPPITPPPTPEPSPDPPATDPPTGTPQPPAPGPEPVTPPGEPTPVDPPPPGEIPAALSPAMGP